MECSLPGSSLHGTVQARVLDWVAMPSSRESSPARDQTRVYHIAGRCFTFWATREYNTHSYNFPPVLLSELEGLSLLSALSTLTLWDLVGVLCGRVCVCVCVHVKSLQLCLTLCKPDYQASLSMGLSRKESWIGFPRPPPRDLPDQRSNCMSYVFCIGRWVLYH